MQTFWLLLCLSLAFVARAENFPEAARTGAWFEDTKRGTDEDYQHYMKVTPQRALDVDTAVDLMPPLCLTGAIQRVR